MRKNIYLAMQENVFSEHEGTILYKIGITKNKIEERLSQLQTGNAGRLSLVCSFETKHGHKMERCLHLHYQQRKVSGEWFCLSEEETDGFLTVCKEKEAMMDFLKSNNHFWQ